MRLGLRTFGVVVALVLFVVSSAPQGLGAAPSAFRYISLTSLPPELPTSSGGLASYPALVVSIANQQGEPTVAPNDITIYLSSSDPAVLAVEPSVIIEAGHQYAIATVSASPTPGGATITAVAPGYEAAYTTFSTHEPRGYPTQLQVYPMPDEFPTGKAFASNFTVIVEDAAGLPARTIQEATIQATSSDTGVVRVGNALIPANKTVGYGTMSTTGVPGVVSVTVSAPGLVTAEAFISVVGGGEKPSLLSLSAPATLPADGATYDSLTVSITDNGSRPAFMNASIPIFLTSSRPDLVSVQPAARIPANSSFVTVPISTSLAAGEAYITASAVNFTSASLPVTTVSIPPTKLGMYVSDASGLITPTANALDFVVQLQDSQGLPAEARTSANVIVSFSNTTLLSSPIDLIIPRGTDLVYGSVPLVRATEGTFTAISNGLFSASVQFAAAPLGVTANIGPSVGTIYPNQTAYVYYSLQYQGRPAAGATLTWTATGGTIKPGSPTTDADGSASALFTPSGAGEATIRLTATDPAIGAVNSTTNILVIPYPVKVRPSLLTTVIKSPIYLGAIAAAAVVAIVAVIMVRRRRGETVEDEDSLGLGPGPGEGTAYDLRLAFGLPGV
ncbi:MAG: Ig-like domain-containing protein [Nitrososphaerota archaeon]|nr:Ig-like domain-containing protein [Nitrososphaerota archaeon]